MTIQEQPILVLSTLLGTSILFSAIFWSVTKSQFKGVLSLKFGKGKFTIDTRDLKTTIESSITTL